MDEEPREPGDEAAHLDAARLGDRAGATDGRHRALVEVGERLARLAVVSRALRADDLREVASLLHRDRAHAGQHLPLLFEAGHVADGEDLGVIRDRAVLANDDAPLAVGGDAQRLRQRVGLHARRPHHRGGADALAAVPRAEAGQLVGKGAVLDLDAALVDGDDARAGAHLRAQLLQLLDRALREALGEAGQDARPRLDERDLRLPRVDRSEVLAQDEPRELGDGARQLDAGGTAADHHEGEELAPLALVGLALRPLEGEEHAAPDLESVLDALEAGRVLLPLVVAEVRGLRAHRHDEEIVGEGVRADVDAPTLEVDLLHLAHDHAHLLVLGHDAADGRGDLRWRQARHGHLVEQRLEQMVVRAVDQGDLDRRPVERLRRLEAPETTTDDHHPTALGIHGSCRGCGVVDALRQCSVRAAAAACPASLPERHATIAVLQRGPCTVQASRKELSP